MQRLIVLLLGLAVGSLHAQEAARVWTSTDGKNVSATLVGADVGNVKLKLPNGSIATLPVARLSEADQQHVAEWIKKQPLKVVIPEVVGVDAGQIKVEVLKEDAEKREFVYRTPHFEFESQGKLAGSLMKEVARDFEATFELLKALPWAIDPRPPGTPYFNASLFRNRNEYLKAGAPANSSGVYMSMRRRFLVPFESLGLREVGSAYRKDDNFDTRTVVHELTHQMMHFWLPFLPQWVVEGTAEYCGNLPLRVGRFRVSNAKGGLRDYVDFLRKRTVEGVPEPYPLEDLFSISGEEWNETLSQNPRISHRLYFTSYLLVYYFMHMDGRGDGERFVRFMRASGESKKRAEEYDNALEEFKQRPEVKVNENGSFSFPASLKPPEMPKELLFGKAREEVQQKNLQVLLDGRSEVQLLKEVRSGFQKLGIRL
ncbi:MAG: hypothetical protein ACR2OZ_06075 [Verrucomicrobiales bacterium]